MANISLREYNREIEGMIEAGKMDRAIAHCQHILKTYSMHIETYQLLGKAFLEAHEYANAADIFQRILNAVPDDFIAHVGMSIIKDDEGKLNESIWHMERAYEVQPSNPAIQGELRRLYGKRDGVEPAKIRLSREALANMYAQGELYNQAIAEIRAILSDDPERPDLQVMLARSYFRAGQKVEAAEMAAHLLKKYPYCVDALRILVEVLPGTARTENIQVYRQRLNLLDPYSSTGTDSVFQPDQTPDAEVILEHLDFQAGKQPPTSSTWATSLGINLNDREKDSPQPGKLMDSKVDGESFLTPFSPSSEEGGKSEEFPGRIHSPGEGEFNGIPEGIEGESEMNAEEISEGEMPDWLKSQIPPELTETKTPQEIADQGKEKDIPGWLNSFRAEQPTPGVEPLDETQPSAIHTVDQFSNEPDEEFRQVPSPEAQNPRPQQDGEIDRMTWLGTLASGGTPEPTDLPSIQEENLPTKEEKEETLAWLESLTQEPEEKADQEISITPIELDEVSDRLKMATEKQPADEGSGFTPEPDLEESIDQSSLETPEWIRDPITEDHPEAVDLEIDQPPTSGEEKEVESHAGESGFVYTPTMEETAKVSPPEGETSQREDDTTFTTWLKTLDAVEHEAGNAQISSTTEPSPSQEVDLPDWLKDLEKSSGQNIPLPPISTEQRPEIPDWLKQDKETRPEEIIPGVPEGKEAELIQEEPDLPRPMAPTSATEWKPEEDGEQIESSDERHIGIIESQEQLEQYPEVDQSKVPESLPVIPPQDEERGLPSTAKSLLESQRLREAVQEYDRIIRTGKSLDEIIHEIREGVNQYPSEIRLWLVLGDAYMRSNRLQDALDAYTKAEELLR